MVRVKAGGHRDLVTVVGHAATVSAASGITGAGAWVNDHARGQRFKPNFYRLTDAASAARMPTAQAIRDGRFDLAGIGLDREEETEPCALVCPVVFRRPKPISGGVPGSGDSLR
jgi:hypothetical protein